MSTETNEVSAIDSHARGPILLLLGSGLVWLVVSGVLALITVGAIARAGIFWPDALG